MYTNIYGSRHPNSNIMDEEEEEEVGLERTSPEPTLGSQSSALRLC